MSGGRKVAGMGRVDGEGVGEKVGGTRSGVFHSGYQWEGNKKLFGEQKFPKGGEKARAGVFKPSYSKKELFKKRDQ